MLMLEDIMDYEDFLDFLEREYQLVWFANHGKTNKVPKFRFIDDELAYTLNVDVDRHLYLRQLGTDRIFAFDGRWTEYVYSKEQFFDAVRIKDDKIELNVKRSSRKTIKRADQNAGFFPRMLWALDGSLAHLFSDKRNEDYIAKFGPSTYFLSERMMLFNMVYSFTVGIPMFYFANKFGGISYDMSFGIVTALAGAAFLTSFIGPAKDFRQQVARVANNFVNMLISIAGYYAASSMVANHALYLPRLIGGS